MLIPAVNAFRYSFTKWDGLSEPVWVGLKNFRTIFGQASQFTEALWHNVYLMFVPGAFILTLALFFAYTIHRGIKGGRAVPIAFFFPNVISSVHCHPLDLHLQRRGIRASQWNCGIWPGAEVPGWVPIMGEKTSVSVHSVRYADTGADPMIVWTATGFYMVLFLAAMENIPESYYEAYKLDGASNSRMFFTVTIPLMWEVLTTGIVFLVIGGLKIFDAVWVMENGHPKPSTHTAATLMYSRVFDEYDIGLGTAIAVCLFILVLLATMVSFRLLKRERLSIDGSRGRSPRRGAQIRVPHRLPLCGGVSDGMGALYQRQEHAGDLSELVRLPKAITSPTSQNLAAVKRTTARHGWRAGSASISETA